MQTSDLCMMGKRQLGEDLGSAHSTHTGKDQLRCVKKGKHLSALPWGWW